MTNGRDLALQVFARLAEGRVFVAGSEVRVITNRCMFCRVVVPTWAAALHPISCDQRPTHLHANWKETYQRRMKHHSWGEKKAEFKGWWTETYGSWHCIRCDNDWVQVHHVTYIRLGQEEMTDLLPICGKHHNELHAR